MAWKDAGGSALGSSRGVAAGRSAANAGGFTASGGNGANPARLAEFATKRRRALMARGEATRKTYSNRAQQRLNAAINNNDYTSVMKAMDNRVYGPRTEVQYVDDLFKG